MIRNPFRPEEEEEEKQPPALPPPSRLTGSGFDREKFIYKLLGSVMVSQLVLYSAATIVCGEQAFRNNTQTEIVCDRVMDQVNEAFSNSVKLLVALLAGQAMNNTHGRQ